MYLTDLATAARKSGLKVIEVKGWKTRGVRAMIRLTGTTWHHTAGPKIGLTPSLRTVLYGRSDLAGPLCNLYVGRDLAVYVIAAGYSNHAGVSLRTEWTSPYRIGIEVDHDGVSPWPDDLYQACVALGAALDEHYRLPVESNLGHKETCSPRGRKIDPNFSMPAFRAAIANHREDDMPYSKKELTEIVGDATTKVIEKTLPKLVEAIVKTVVPPIVKTEVAKAITATNVKGDWVAKRIIHGGDPDQPLPDTLASANRALARIETEVTK